MIARCLFDLLLGVYRPIAASLVGAGLFLSACSSDDSGLAAVYRGASDSLNATPQPPPPGPWRLASGPVPPDTPFPKLSDVPPRPTDLPSRESLDRTAADLAADNRTVETAGRPSAAQLGAPPAPRLAALSVPGVGTLRHPTPDREPAPAAGQPTPIDKPATPDLVLPLADAAAFAPAALDSLDAFARRQRHRAGRILIGLPPNPSASPDRSHFHSANRVRERLIAAGVAPARLWLTQGRVPAAITLTAYPQT